MPIGAITGYIDVAQVALYVFWLFFAALIIYLHRENKREGYPLESDRSNKVKVQGYPPVPAVKEYLLPDGRVMVTHRADNREVLAEPVANWPGAPMQPTGDPMVDGVGAAAYAERADVPEEDLEGNPRIVPLRVATDFKVTKGDPDPRGMQVVCADDKIAGTVKDVWVDRSEIRIRYLEVDVANVEPPRQVLVPMTLVKLRQVDRVRTDVPIDQRLLDKPGRPREVVVKSVLAQHFDKAPLLKNPDQITLLEEDKITAFFGGGHLYAFPGRQEPLL